MKAPTEKQIAEEIDKLKDLRPNIPSHTFFGDSNLEKIDAQIRVLKEGMDEDKCYAEFEDPEDPEGTADLVSNARDAVLWLHAEEPDAPSKAWACLDKRKKK